MKRSSGIKVFAPASVSNVAVGFDILGFALEKPGDEVIVREGKQKGLRIISIHGNEARLPYEIHLNTAGFAAQKLLDFLGESDCPLEMEIFKKMPFGSGLGSSAASAVAGVFAVSEFLRTGLPKSALLPFAVEAEVVADGAYHADNVAPCLFGGMILIRDNASLDVKRIYVPSGLTAVVIYPKIKILTRDSRAVLSDTLDMKTAILQQGNLAAFVAAMYTGDFDLLGRCLNDVWIEPQRAHLIPTFYDMKEIALASGALGFSISGAGPSMFALTQNTHVAQEISDKAKSLYKQKGIDLEVFISGINQEGVVIY